MLKLKRLIISKKRLHLVFWFIGGLILILTGFSIYFMKSIGDAHEITIYRKMPIMTSALRLSEQSAILAATAPALGISNNEKELGETFSLLVGVFSSIKADLDNLPNDNGLNNLKQLGEETDRMEKELFDLKEIATKSLLFSKRRTIALAEIHAVQKNLIEVLTPLEYGVTSLTNLFGKRSARRIESYYKQRGEKRGFKDSPSGPANREAFVDEEISQLTEGAIKDMGYSLSLKTNGNNLINLLFILSEAETTEQISLLQEQFVDALSWFSHASEIFRQSALAIRNPVLSSTVESIGDKFKTVTQGENSLFFVRKRQLEIENDIQKSLEETRKIAAQMSTFSQSLAAQVDEHIQAIQEEMKNNRKSGLLLILVVSGGCLLMTYYIAFSAITSIKKQEEELQLSHTQLEHRVYLRTKELQRSSQQLARLAMAIDNAAEEVVITDADGVIEFVNPAFELISGYTSTEVVGKRTGFFTDGDDNPNLSEKIWEKISSGNTWRSRITCKRKDGLLINKESTISPIINDSNEVIGFVSVSHDISEQIKAENEIKMFNEELEQRVMERTSQLEASREEMEAFSYSVSHDLRAPLRHIDGFAAILTKKHSDQLSEDALYYLNTITDSAKKMGVLIDNLLSFSRTGRTELRKSPVKMNKVIKEALTQVESSLVKRKIEWKIVPLPAIQGDYNLLLQVWTNLLDNALKYTSTREKAIISIACKEAKDELVFYIQDNGVGFDMKYAPKLFGVFQRLHSSAEFDGTGIGLAIVRRIILRHGGRTWAEGDLDKGAIFYFSIPKPSISGLVNTFSPNSHEAISFIDIDANLRFQCGD